MSDYLYPIRTLTQTGSPLGGVSIHAESPNGPWNAVTDDCGWFNAYLHDGEYDVTFSKPGYANTVEKWNLGNPPKNPILVGLTAGVPPFPTRDQVCDVFSGFQGIYINTQQFGRIPAFGPECGALNDTDTSSYCQQMKGFKFTHTEFDLSWQYSESDYQYPVPGMDLAYNLDEACRRVALMVNNGMRVKVTLAGDGMSVSDNPQQGQYNDPQGWTYGFQWLMNNLERILLAFKNYPGMDLTRHCIFVPGYDGVFYGWGIPGEVPDLQPQRVIDFGNKFRSILPNGYLGIEHSTGKIPVGESGQDWKTNGPLDAYDTLLSEYDPFNLHSDNTWQIVGRCTRPYNRPPDQPANDDPNPPYIIEDCTRGKRFYIMYELFTYLWVRGHYSIQQSNDDYDYFTTMAPNATLCLVRQ